MAHFKLLQHPLGKTEGSVLLSQLNTHIPPAAPLPCPWAPTQPRNSRASPLPGGWGSPQGQPQEPRLLQTCPNLARMQLWSSTHAVWIPSECHLLHAGIFIHLFFFPDFPQAAEFLARQHLQATQQPAICLHLFMFTKNFALFSLPGKLVMLSKKAISCLLYYLP